MRGEYVSTPGCNTCDVHLRKTHEIEIMHETPPALVTCGEFGLDLDLDLGWADEDDDFLFALPSSVCFLALFLSRVRLRTTLLFV